MSSRDDDLDNPYYVRMMNGPVGRFGAYLMDRSYDRGMRSATAVLDGEHKNEIIEAKRARLGPLSDRQREAILELVRDSVIEALHGLLHGLSHDEKLVRVLFEGHDVATESDGLHGDLFWWLRDLSKYPYDVSEKLG